MRLITPHHLRPVLLDQESRLQTPLRATHDRSFDRRQQYEIIYNSLVEANATLNDGKMGRTILPFGGLL